MRSPLLLFPLLGALLLAPSAAGEASLVARSYELGPRAVLATSHYAMPATEAGPLRAAADADGDGHVSAQEAGRSTERMRTGLAEARAPATTTLDGDGPRRVALLDVTYANLHGPTASTLPLGVQYVVSITYPAPRAERPVAFEKQLAATDAGPWSVRAADGATLLDVRGLRDVRLVEGGFWGIAPGEGRVVVTLLLAHGGAPVGGALALALAAGALLVRARARAV